MLCVQGADPSGSASCLLWQEGHEVEEVDEVIGLIQRSERREWVQKRFYESSKVMTAEAGLQMEFEAFRR